MHARLPEPPKSRQPDFTAAAIADDQAKPKTNEISKPGATMVRTKGPMLSVQASGTIAKTITHSSWKGRSYAKKFAIPTNNQQSTQLGVRAGMKFLAEQWTLLSAANQATWETIAAQHNISPFNAYQGVNLTRLTNGQGITKEEPAIETPVTGVLQIYTPVAFPTFVALRLTSFPISNKWPFFIYRDANTGFTPGASNLVHAVLATVLPADLTINDTPPTHGTWYYRYASSSADGAIGPNATEESVIF